jgi:DegV family protein with EDD domain
MLKLGILIDASAEVPPHVLANPHVRMLPIPIQIDAMEFIDKRSPQSTSDFNSKYLTLRAAEVSQSIAPTSPQISQFFVDHIAREFDHVFGLFVSSSRSQIFKNAFDASSKAILDSMALRAQNGIKGPLLVECHDSLNVFTGYGVQVMEALRQFETTPAAAQIRANMQSCAKNAYGYAAPSQLDFILTRAKAKGEQSVGKLSKAAAKMLGIIPILHCNQGMTEAVDRVRGPAAARDTILNIARRELGQGLLAPFINVSFTGNTDTVQAMATYKTLCEEAKDKGVTVSLQETSPTGSINLGPDALTVGFIGKPHSPTL